MIDPRECEHTTIRWDPYEVSRNPNGTYEIWQYGRCEACGQETLLSTEATDAKETFRATNRAA